MLFFLILPGMIMYTGWIGHTGGDFLCYREGIIEGIGRVTAAVDVERIATAQALRMTTKAARNSGSIARACRESEPNKAITLPPSLMHRYVHEYVGFGLAPMAALGALADMKTKQIVSKL